MQNFEIFLTFGCTTPFLGFQKSKAKISKKFYTQSIRNQAFPASKISNCPVGGDMYTTGQ